MKIMLTRRQWLVIGGTVLVLIICGCLFCGRANAADIKGQFFIPVSARYIEDWGVAGGVAYQDDKTKMVFSLQVSYDQFNGVSGTTQYAIGCRQYQVPYSVSNSGHRGVEFSLLIPVGKKK